jgi:hypothetical protein
MSVAVLLEQEVVFEKGFGYADIEEADTRNSQRPRIISPR